MSTTADDVASRLKAGQKLLPPPSSTPEIPTPSAPASRVPGATVRPAVPAKPTIYVNRAGEGGVGIDPNPDTQGVASRLQQLRQESTNRLAQVPETNTARAVAGRAGPVPEAAAPAAAPAATNAAAAAEATPGVFSRIGGVLRGVGSRLPLIQAVYETAHNLSDPRYVQAASAGTGGANDVAETVARGLATVGTLGMAGTPTEQRRSEAAESGQMGKAFALLHANPDEYQSYVTARGAALRSAYGAQLPDPSLFLSPDERAQAQAAGSAAASGEIRRQTAALGQPNDVAYGVPGSRGVASSVMSGLNAIMPSRIGAVPAAAPVATAPTAGAPAQSSSTPPPVLPSGPQAEQLAGTINRGLAAIGLGGGAAAPSGPDSTGGTKTSGSGRDALGAFTIDGQGRIIRNGKVDTAGNVNIIPGAPQNVASGLPKMPTGSPVAYAPDNGSSDFRDLIKTTIAGLGKLNNASKRALAGELLSAYGGNVNAGVGAGAQTSAESARLAQQAAEFPITQRTALEQAQIGRYGLQPQEGEDGRQYLMRDGVMRPVMTDQGKPFVGMLQRDAAKQEQVDEGVAQKLYAAALSSGEPSASYSDILEEVRASHGANSVGAGAGGPTATSPAAPKVPKVGAVVRGYRFKGGDPSDQANWEKAN
ncbi:MAG: hypothetical protein JSS23_00175 [Proteobacteria bacterium]|nr:hypothetical protein [Pseudomonadota bacterium]